MYVRFISLDSRSSSMPVSTVPHTAVCRQMLLLIKRHQHGDATTTEYPTID